MKRTPLLRLLFLGASAFLFLSCVDIDAKISIARDGSGELDLVYRVSKLVMNLGNAEKEKPPLPLPVAEDDFARTVRSINGLALKRYARNDDTEKTTINATLAFADIKALGALLGDDGDSFSLTTEGGTTTFTQVLAPGNAEPLDAKTKEFFQAFFKSYGLSYTVTAPAPIKATSMKEAVVKDREATVRLSVLAAAEAKDPILWKVSW